MNVGESLPPGNFRLGRLLLEGPLVLAPLAGYTIPPFRRLCRRLGASLTFTEMISASGLLHGNQATRALLEKLPGEDPVGAQLFGADPDLLARAARIVQEAGFHVVDINMGCPVPKVTRTGAGAALLKDPGRAREITAAVAGAVDLPVTVKLRAGWDEDRLVAPDLAPLLVEAGAAAVTVHGRTREQGYAGRADWGVVRACRESLQGRAPLFGSGDLFDPCRCVEILQRGDCDGLQLARGALSRPWIFRETLALLAGRDPLPPGPEEIGEAGREILAWLTERKGIPGGVQAFRSFFCFLVKGRPGASRLRRAIFSARAPGEAEEIIREAFPPPLPGRPGPPDARLPGS